MIRTKKYLKYIDNQLVLKNTPDGEETILGDVKTKKGSLRREQKLKAVAANGAWVEV